MARRKKTSETESADMTTKTVQAELQSGDVVGADDELLEKKGGTVCICANVPHDIKFLVPDAGGRLTPLVIKGNGNHLKGADRGILAVGAYGITANVPEEAWAYICRSYKDFKAIKNGLIFASTPSNARAAAKERKDLRHGLEPVDPDKARNTRPANS